MLAHFTVGSGSQSVILLHGFLGSGRNLRSLAVAWSGADPSRRFLLPDLSGHGESHPPPPGATLADLGKEVLETARAAGFTGKLELVGHSLGGRVALGAMQAEPESVSRVSLLDIAPGAIPRSRSDSGAVLGKLLEAPATAPDRRAMKQDLMNRGLSAPIADWLVMNLEPVDGQVRWRFDRSVLNRLHSEVNDEDLWSVLESRTVPIRCIRGGRSPYVTDEDVRRMEAAGCPVKTLPGVGHFVHVDAADELLAWLREA